MKLQLPHTFLGIHIEAWMALIAFSGAPIVLSPIFVNYPTKEVCGQVAGCEELLGSPVDWVSADDYVGFRKVLKLKVVKGADHHQVMQEVTQKAAEALPSYLSVFPVREPKIELVQQEVSKKKGKKK